MGIGNYNSFDTATVIKNQRNTGSLLSRTEYVALEYNTQKSQWLHSFQDRGNPPKPSRY